MIDTPGLRLSIEPAMQFCAVGTLAHRVSQIALNVFARIQPELDEHSVHLSSQPPCRIIVEQAAREHTGLGVGTQLSLSIAAGLRAFFSLPPMAASALAKLTGRCERSAVGTYGFEQGGLIVEAGQRSHNRPIADEPATDGNKTRPNSSEGNSPLIARVALPESWRFVLFIRRELTGLSGDAERQAFAKLPPVPVEITERLTRLAALDLIPAAVEQDFARFGTALFEYGLLAGECFASQQCGAFTNHETAALVTRLRQQGVNGVGQTSWGPTVFALLDSCEQAADLIDHLDSDLTHRYEVIVASPAKHGARVQCRVNRT